jgi:hypothetical protein
MNSSATATKPSTLHLRERLISIARRDVGGTETSKNHGPAIGKFWPATNYPDGYADRAPYCAAAVCYWVREWLQDPDVLAALGKTAEQAEKWRCKSAAAFGWDEWARDGHARAFDANDGVTLHTGDIVVFSFSHIGILYDDAPGSLFTIEANTNDAGGRDGDGIWQKTRAPRLVRRFVRLLE